MNLNDKVIQERIAQAVKHFEGTRPWYKRLFKSKVSPEVLAKMMFALHNHFNIEFQPKHKTLTVEANGTVTVYDLQGTISKEDKFVYAICDTYLKAVGEGHSTGYDIETVENEKPLPEVTPSGIIIRV